MRIAGVRRDGAMNLSIGGGLAVILKGDRVSPPVDIEVAEKLGPWKLQENANTWDARRRMTAKVDLAKIAPIEHFHNLAMSFDETRDRVMTALRSRLGLPTSSMYSYGPGGMDLYVPQNGLGPDWVVYCMNGKHYGLAYEVSESGTVEFKGDASEVRATWESMDEDSDFDGAIELKQTEWFKKFMASKKKMMGGDTTPEMPTSLPNISMPSSAKTDLPGTLKNANKKENCY